MPFTLYIPAERCGCRFLAQKCCRRHLSAGHAVDGVVHEDRDEVLAPVRSMNHLGRPDGGQVAVALVAEDELVGPDALEARGDLRRAAVGGSPFALGDSAAPSLR